MAQIVFQSRPTEIVRTVFVTNAMGPLPGLNNDSDVSSRNAKKFTAIIEFDMEVSAPDTEPAAIIVDRLDNATMRLVSKELPNLIRRNFGRSASAQLSVHFRRQETLPIEDIFTITGENIAQLAEASHVMLQGNRHGQIGGFFESNELPIQIDRQPGPNRQYIRLKGLRRELLRQKPCLAVSSVKGFLAVMIAQPIQNVAQRRFERLPIHRGYPDFSVSVGSHVVSNLC